MAQRAMHLTAASESLINTRLIFRQSKETRTEYFVQHFAESCQIPHNSDGYALR